MSGKPAFHLRLLIIASGFLYSGIAIGDDPLCGAEPNWYLSSFYLLHEDHHTSGQVAVGRDADPAETRRLIALSQPDVIQIHAKGNPGWTTYPSKIGHTPPKLARDVLAVWRDIARQDGYHFSVYYNLGRDGEIMQRHPAWNRVNAGGQPVERALCYHSGVAEQYLWPMIDEIIENYHPDGFWFDGSCFTVRNCYCEQCRERFQRETGQDPPKSAKDAAWPKYKEMQRQIYRECVHETIRRIKTKRPQCLVAFNWAWSLRMPETPDPTIDYLTGDRGWRVDDLSRDAHWYDSLARPFDLMTTGHYRNGGVVTSKPAEQVCQEMAIIVANGGRYFAWDNPSPTSGLDAGRMQFMAQVVAPFLRERQAWCLGTTRVPEVSLLNSAAAHYAATLTTPVCFPPADPRILGATDALSAAHLDYEMISDDRLRAGDIRTPVLWAEDPLALAARGAEAMRAFVERGGTLVITGAGFANNGLGDLVGLKSKDGRETLEQWSVTLAGREHTVRHQLCRTELAGAESLVEARDGAGQSYPLATRRAIGKGQAVAVLVPLLAREQNADLPDALRSWIFEQIYPARQRRLSTDAPPTVETVQRRKGDRLVLHLVNRAPGKQTAYPSKNEPNYRITDIPSAPGCHVSLRLEAKPAAVMLQPQGKLLANWRYADGRMEIDVPEFAVHQMIVIEPESVSPNWSPLPLGEG